jgi:hypothetical protein
MGGSFIAKRPPLWGWITGKKSFDESLKTDGGGWEQRINRGILNAMGRGSKAEVGYHKPYNFQAMQGMMQNNTSNQMMGDLLAQQAMANQAESSQKAADLQAANARQQQNINAAMQNSKQNMNNFLLRTPVPSTFSAITPATQNKTTNNSFKTPNVAGLTFGS